MPRAAPPRPAAVPDASAAGATDPVGRFEEAMQELETIVQSLERGELRLEESLRLFERGVTLARQCRNSLQSAELKVQELVAAAGTGDQAP